MESAEQVRRMKQAALEDCSVIPAVVTSLVGILGMVAIAAGPWMLLTADATWQEPGFQSATTSPAVAESKRIFDDRRERLAAGPQGGSQMAVISVAAGAQGSR